ncbi:hypothetical protein Pla100_55440 [Neorhodopirellula pilleata]|uniref:Uncharacterized protein n=1 Tax=Neorhodopirellula pilleata TaxID=2714738 RepID=A0A5C5ZRF7_9BACT|nr:hypothetical protein Pla100_55440 [Neorhodopirellula pilleata]
MPGLRRSGCDPAYRKTKKPQGFLAKTLRCRLSPGIPDRSPVTVVEQRWRPRRSQIKSRDEDFYATTINLEVEVGSDVGTVENQALVGMNRCGCGR